MELKTPTKKGIKTPRYRPPLPILNESCSGWCIDEYDWPLFNGYYNGTSVIVDDTQAMTLLTNKGFFGKGSLSKGCPNLAKRKIPINVVYESQWKRRKMWIQSLNTFLESKKISNETLEGNVVDIDNKRSNDAEIIEIDKNSHLQNNSCKSKKEPSKTEESKNNSNETSIDNMIDIDKKSNDVEKMEVGEKNYPPTNSCKTEEKPSKTSGNEESKNNSNETSIDNMVDIDDKKSNDAEKMEIDEKHNPLNNSCKTEDGPCKTNGKKDIKKNSNETPQDNNVDIDNKKSNDVEKKEVEIHNEKNSPPQNNSGKTEEEPFKIHRNEDNKDSKNNSNESPEDSVVAIDSKKINDVEKQVNNEKNSSCKTEEETSKTNGNESSRDGKVSLDTDIDIIHIIEEPEGQKEIRDSHKNEEIINIAVCTNQNENKLKDNERIDDRSKCVGKLNLSNYTEKGILNINDVLVIPDVDGELEQYFLNLKPYIEEEKVKTAIEVLYLSLEEAFFLSYSCNCLQIFDLTSNILQIRDMWVLFQESQPDFIEKYVAYHYFRAKGWVVKSGTKFGGDFLLYKKGPLYFHASYIVIVDVLKNDKNSRNKITWQKIVGMNRMAESANKEILICHVLWPDVKEEKLNDPEVLKEFRVSEILLRRWQATHEKTP